MSGTPLDLTPFGSVLTAIGWLYWLVALAILGTAWWLPKVLWQKIAAVAIAVAAVYLLFVRPVQTRLLVQQQQRQESTAKLDQAMAVFKKRCEEASEKITRTVENVEGVLLVNVRPIAKSSDRGDSNWPDAALPDEKQGDWYLRSFLFWEQHQDKRSPRGYLNNSKSDLPGYRFVDVKDPDGSIYRYRLAGPEMADLVREAVKGSPARYAVSYVNLIDPSDRAKWVAGTRVFITDTTTNEAIAESTWYSIDLGQGSTAGFRSPWGLARTCPDLSSSISSAPTRAFVDRVLKPRKGE